MNTHLVGVTPINYKNQARFCKNVFSAIWITKSRSSESAFSEVDLIPLTGPAEVDNVSQILFYRRRDITVRRSQCVQLQIFFILHLSDLFQVWNAKSKTSNTAPILACFLDRDIVGFPLGALSIYSI